MQAIILCGGKGTRLSTLYADRPKILVPVAGLPFLEWQLEWLGRMGVADIHLAGGYRADALMKWLNAASQESGKGGEQHTAQPLFTVRAARMTFHISLSTEPAPLGTGGGLRFVEPWLRSDPVLVLNGDSLAPNLDLGALTSAHQQSDCRLTIAVTRIEEAGRYGTVEFSTANRITAFREKADRSEGWVNAGIYLIGRQFLKDITEGQSLSLETDLFPHYANRGILGACPCLPPLLDMGTPDGIQAMESFLLSDNGQTGFTTPKPPMLSSRNKAHYP
jgi:D-glycero-alpha-D-manno-heptose 1-phosphate guanylyltransferase